MYFGESLQWFTHNAIHFLGGVGEVMMVRAVDYDEGVNADVTYKITSAEGSGIFTIDNNGILRSSTELDREMKDSYQLIIRATDKGQNPRSSMYIALQIYLIYIIWRNIHIGH